MRQQAVDRVERLARADFERDYLRPGRPVIFKNAIAGWRAHREWTPETLGSRVGARMADVIVGDTGLFAYRPDGVEFRVQLMPFTDIVGLVTKATPSPYTHYIVESPIPRDYPELMDDLEVPELAQGRGRRLMPLLWFGAVGCVTPLHYDTANNWFAQVYGNKRFTLFDPSQTAHLYPFPATSNYPHMSFVDVERPDLERYPAYRAAEPIDCVVEAGDLLYLPALWWHHVRSLTVGISVSYFAPLTLGQLLTPQGLRLLPYVTRAHMQEVKAELEATGRADGHLGVARSLLEQGKAWPAVMFARAALVELEALFEGVTSGPLHDQLQDWLGIVARAMSEERDQVTHDEAARLISGVGALEAAVAAVAAAR